MAQMKLLLAGSGMVLVLGLTACGAAAGDGSLADQPVSGGGDGAAGTCPVGATDCVDTPQLDSDEPVAVDETGVAQSKRDAKFYLGKPQAELSDQVRIARRGDEMFMLTEDYVLGRITVELDNVDGAFIVTKSTVELPGGPKTFTLDQ